MAVLKVAVVVMAVMIVAGVTTLGFLLVQRVNAPSAAAGDVLLDEPAGTRIAASTAVDGKLVLQLQGGGPDRAVVVDLRTGRVTGRIGLKKQDGGN